jgi:hypothetical protein
MENTAMEKGCNYGQRIGSCDRLPAMAAVELEECVTEKVGRHKSISNITQHAYALYGTHYRLLRSTNK